MNINEWFEDPKVLEKSKRGYAHFDLRTDLSKCRNYITNPENIVRHGFYPFIKYDLEYHKYNKLEGRKLKNVPYVMQHILIAVFFSITVS